LLQTHQLGPGDLMVVAIHDIAIRRGRIGPRIGYALQRVRGKGGTDQGHRASGCGGLHPDRGAAQPAGVKAAHRLEYRMLWRRWQWRAKTRRAVVGLFTASKEGHESG